MSDSYKRLLGLLSFFMISVAAVAIPVSVDENIEFISAVCRLAGFDEYVDDTNKSYTARLDSVMAQWSGHKAVDYLKTVRNLQAVGYDAIAALAVHTQIAGAHLVLAAGADLSSVDGRWKNGQDKEIVQLLDDLYRLSCFNDFYESNVGLYSHAVDNARILLSDCDLEWLNQFYGKELSGSRVVLSLLNRGNYGMTKKTEGQPEESVIIICCRELDDNGYPVFTGRESLIIHESSHPVCNPLILDNIERFNNNIELAAELMNDELANQSYSGGKTMMCETMVRSVELQYALAHAKDGRSYENYMRNQMANGFFLHA